MSQYELLHAQAINDTMNQIVEEYRAEGRCVASEFTEEEWVAVVSERSMELAGKRLERLGII